MWVRAWVTFGLVATAWLTAPYGLVILLGLWWLWRRS